MKVDFSHSTLPFADELEMLINTGKTTIPVSDIDDFREASRGIITDMFPEYHGDKVTLYGRKVNHEAKVISISKQ